MSVEHEAGNGRETSLLGLMNTVLRQRRVIVGVTGAVFLLVVGVTVMLPRTYTATGTFLPQTEESSLSRFSGLAAQFGFSLGATAGGESPEFYVQLLRSREILGRVVQDTFLFEGRTGFWVWGDSARRRGTLMDFWGIEDEAPGKRRELAIEELRGQSDASADRETQTVQLRVTTRWPDLSRQVAERMLGLVQEFNLKTRQSQAASEREFIEGRLGAARQELRSVEDGLEQFLLDNREFRSSPTLQFQYDRLQQEVSLQQQVVVSLVQAYEQARIEEVRNTPVLTMVEEPERPARPDRRRLALKGILGILAGGVLGVFLALFREVMAVGRGAAPDEFQEFVRLRREAAKDVRRLIPFRGKPAA